jgi:hypothetical protein
MFFSVLPTLKQLSNSRISLAAALEDRLIKFPKSVPAYYMHLLRLTLTGKYLFLASNTVCLLVSQDVVDYGIHRFLQPLPCRAKYLVSLGLVEFCGRRSLVVALRKRNSRSQRRIFRADHIGDLVCANGVGICEVPLISRY